MRVFWAFNAAQWEPSPEEWAHALSCVQPEERARIARFVFRDDAKRALAGRLLARRAVSVISGVPAAALVLTRNAHGKPLVGAPPAASRVHFNVSHDGDFCVLVADTVPVGVDVMRVALPRGSASAGEFFRSLRSEFSDGEWLAILRPPSERERLEVFYQLWCLKECYIKAVGVGLSMPLSRLSFAWQPRATGAQRDLAACDDSARLAVDGADIGSNWRFSLSWIDADHCVAVAADAAGAPWPTAEMLSYSALIGGVAPLPE